MLVIDAELHSDEEALFPENGSKQEDLRGINIYPEVDRGEPGFVEFDALINVRPSQGNRSGGVDDPETRKKILAVVGEWTT